MSEVVNGSMKDVLGFIKESRGENVYGVYIPSLKRNVMFSEMTTKHQKTIIKTMMDNPIFNNEFIFAIRGIIIDTCAEELDVDSLTIIDKMMICLNLRLKSIGDGFKFHFKNSDMTTELKTSDFISKLKDITLNGEEEIVEGNVKILCGYPTIGSEYALESEFRNTMKDLDIKSRDDIKTLIGNTFMVELVKYIKTITIIKDNTEIKLDMQDYGFDDRIEIIEEIGITATKKVLDYITESMKEFKKIMTVEVDLSEEESKKYKTKKLTSRLEAGSDFFIIS